jgi:BCD family chlorophyll transporter-like MFS transporter
MGAFAAVILSAPVQSVPLFAVGVFGIGLGGGLFSVGTLTSAMALAVPGTAGLALGAWGAVQATATGLAIAIGGLMRDGISHLAVTGRLGPGLADASVGYSFVWHLEIVLLFAALVALGPLASWSRGQSRPTGRFGLPEFPA